MKIETKFSIGDFVYPISQKSVYVFKECPICKGTGQVTIMESDTKTYCPTCYGKKGENEYQAKEWDIAHDCVSHVGKIDLNIYAVDDEDHESEYRYMIKATGIGSGRLWREDDLFKTKKEAQKECDKRNGK